MQVGSSELHNGRSHKLHERRGCLDAFRQPPSDDSAVETLSAEEAAAMPGISASATPLVVRDCLGSWRATERWSSAESLCEHYGDVPFELAEDLTLTMSAYVEYAGAAEADYPYYLVERRF